MYSKIIRLYLKCKDIYKWNNCITLQKLVSFKLCFYKFLEYDHIDIWTSKQVILIGDKILNHQKKNNITLKFLCFSKTYIPRDVFHNIKESELIEKLHY